jgi:two-component system, LytTR family, response regulator
MTTFKDNDSNPKDISEVVFFEGNVNYSTLHTINATFTTSKTLKTYEENLDDSAFIRIHKSFIVNTRFIASLNCNEKPKSLTMKNGKTLEISRRRAKSVKKKLKELKFI